MLREKGSGWTRLKRSTRALARGFYGPHGAQCRAFGAVGDRSIALTIGQSPRLWSNSHGVARC